MRNEKNNLLIIESVMRLKGFKNMTFIKKEGKDLYSHVNTRGRKRYMLLCYSQEGARKKSEELKGEYFKSFGTWICFYENKENFEYIKRTEELEARCESGAIGGNEKDSLLDQLHAEYFSE